MASYPNGWVDDGKLWCYTTIAEAGSYTVAYTTNGWTTLEIDDAAVTSSETQTLSAGEHILKFTLSDPTTIPGGLFRNITMYSMICFPSGTTTIGDYLFYPCSTATTVIMDKSKITSIGTGAFKQASVEIGDLYFPNLTSLGNGAFDRYSGGNNYQIKSLGNVTTIPDSCFSQSPYKTYVIPSTVTSLGSQSLLSWDYDKTIVCYADTPPTVGSLWVYRPPVAIYVPTNSVAAYKEASGWLSYASIIYPIWEEKLININHLSLGDFRRRIMLGISKPMPPWIVERGTDGFQFGKFYYSANGAITGNTDYCITRKLAVKGGHTITVNRGGQSAYIYDIQRDASDAIVGSHNGTPTPTTYTLSANAKTIEVTFSYRRELANLADLYIYDETAHKYIWAGDNIIIP